MKKKITYANSRRTNKNTLKTQETNIHERQSGKSGRRFQKQQ